MRSRLAAMGVVLLATTASGQGATLKGQVVDGPKDPTPLREWVLEGREPGGQRYRGLATLTREGGEDVLTVRFPGGRTRRSRGTFDPDAGTWTFVVERTIVGTLGAAGVLESLGLAEPKKPADRTVREVITYRPSAGGPFLEGQLTADGKPGARERLISPAELTAELQGRYGARPRSYAGFFNGSNEAERVMLETLRRATADANARLAARGLRARVDMAMLATNFISEGGYYPLDSNNTTHVSGFGHLGVDTIVDNYAAVRPWLPEAVRPRVEDPKNHHRTRNEKGEQVTTVSTLTLAEGVQANAAMFAMYTAQLERDLAQRGVDIATLDPRVQFFWSTVYFNAGPGTGRRMLDQQGVQSARRKYTGPESNRNARFNATWRTGAYELLSRRVLPEAGDEAAWTRFQGGS